MALQLSFPVNGDPTLIDLVLQSVFVDFSLPQGLTFTNAVKAQFGR